MRGYQDQIIPIELPCLDEGTPSLIISRGFEDKLKRVLNYMTEFARFQEPLVFKG